MTPPTMTPTTTSDAGGLYRVVVVYASGIRVIGRPLLYGEALAEAAARRSEPAAPEVFTVRDTAGWRACFERMLESFRNGETDGR
jgi:hypothetical protein